MNSFSEWKKKAAVGYPRIFSRAISIQVQSINSTSTKQSVPIY